MIVVDDGVNLKLWMALPFAAYLCGNVLFADKLGDILWPVCVDFLNNYPIESLWS